MMRMAARSLPRTFLSDNALEFFIPSMKFDELRR